MIVVIDMQESFEAARDEQTIEQVVKLIKQGRLLNERILVVEYDTAGDTVEPIMEALDGYDRWDVVTKWEDDGSSVIKRYSDRLEQTDESFVFEDEPFTFCGVNWGACVSDTVNGMAEYTDNLHVVEAACNQPEAWEDMQLGIGYFGFFFGNRAWDDVREEIESVANVI